MIQNKNDRSCSYNLFLQEFTACAVSIFIIVIFENGYIFKWLLFLLKTATLSISVLSLSHYIKKVRPQGVF